MKLIMMRGLSCSGKTTKAKEMIETYGNFVRVNRDDLRSMLHFDKWSSRNEGVTMDVQKSVVENLLKNGENVIVDDTNLLDKHKDRWSNVAKECGAKFEIMDMKTPYKECLERERSRNKLPMHVIFEQALMSDRYENDQVDLEKGIVVCDLDGTLCDIKHRLHHVKKEPKDWESFFGEIRKDGVKEKTYQMLIDLREDHPIIFVTARPEEYREDTLLWLQNKTDLTILPNFLGLLMRRKNDVREDAEVKQGIYDTYLKNLKIHAVLDDRGKVLDAVWRPLQKEGKIEKVIPIDEWKEV